MRGAYTVAFLLAAGLAPADFSAEAFDNATIQVTGPRTGSAGINFFNIQGQGVSEAFRSWGAADFRTQDFEINFGVPVASVSNFRVRLTQSNAAFTTAGMLEFWLSSDVSTSITPGEATPLVWQNGATPSGVGNQLPLTFLGAGAFTATGSTGSGTLDEFAFGLAPAAHDMVVAALNGDGVIRLVVTPADQAPNPEGVSATYAGYNNATYAGPTLVFDAEPVPEPASLAAIGIGLMLLSRRRARR